MIELGFFKTEDWEVSQFTKMRLKDIIVVVMINDCVSHSSVDFR